MDGVLRSVPHPHADLRAAGPMHRTLPAVAHDVIARWRRPGHATQYRRLHGCRAASLPQKRSARKTGRAAYSPVRRNCCPPHRKLSHCSQRTPLALRYHSRKIYRIEAIRRRHAGITAQSCPTTTPTLTRLPTILRSAALRRAGLRSGYRSAITGCAAIDDPPSAPSGAPFVIGMA